MSAPRIEVSETTTLEPARDGRLLPYGAITFLALGASLVFGEPSIAPIAVPFALALAVGLRRTGPVEVTSRIVLFADRVLEGDQVDGHLEIAWQGEADAHAVIHRLRGVSAQSPKDASQWIPSTEQVELPIRLTAAHWGRHTIGDVWLRLTLPGGLVSWTGQVLVGPPVRVLPGTERLSQLLSPMESRTVWGVHGSSRVGEGHEFAELRPYVPGDRLRDLNWAATARHGRSIVNRHHPEVSGDVVIAVETYDDGSAASARILAKTARAAWALASVHMRANDRVGLVGLGGSTRWLPPAGGRLAQYTLMDTLLRMGGEAVERISVARRAVDVPQGALIIALSTLHDDHSLLTLMSWRVRGRSVVVVMMDPSALLDPPESPAEALARRLWDLELERRIGELRRVGIAVVRAPVDGDMAPVVSALRRARRSTVTMRR